jgi:membrane protein YdbS with pleckstrin-like domain/TPR repeat protein
MSTDTTAAYSMAEAACLLIISGCHHGHRIEVPASGIMIGRDGELSSLFGDDPLVSRSHAKLSIIDNGSVQVEDLGSTNGTLINGIAIFAPSRLNVTDVLRIGNVEMRLAYGQETVLAGGAHTESAPRSGPELLEAGRALLEQERYEASRRAFLAAARLPDSSAEACYGLGVIALSQGDLPLAEGYFEQAIYSGPGHANALYQLGYICEQRRDRQAAGDYYHRALAAHPGHAGALVGLERTGFRSPEPPNPPLSSPEQQQPSAPAQQPPAASPVDLHHSQGVYQLLQADQTAVSQQAVALMDRLECEVRPPRYSGYVGRYFTQTVAWLALPVVFLIVARVVVGVLSSRYSGTLPSFLAPTSISHAIHSLAIVMLCAGLVIILIGFVRVRCTAVRIRQGRLQIEKGVFHKHVTNVDFWRVQNIDLDRRLVNRLTGDSTLVLSLTFGVLPERYKWKRNWKKPKLKVVEICGLAKRSELEQTFQDLLSLSFLLRGNPIVKGIIQ